MGYAVRCPDPMWRQDLKTYTRMKSILALLIFVAAVSLTAATGAYFAPGDWYAALQKPPWNPPDWIFPPVWTVLYLTIAASGWLAWRHAPDGHAPLALGVYLVQLVLNAAWSWLFFGLHRPGLALAEIVLLWLSILATIVLFWRIKPLAGVLLLPYLLWVGFAAALNGTLWALNP